MDEEAREEFERLVGGLGSSNWVGIHQIFLEILAAGFTPHQATCIIGCGLFHGNNNPGD